MAFTMGGAYVYFAVRLVHIRQAMREKIAALPAEELEQVVLLKEDFARFRQDEHEVKVNGRMFDIAYMVECGNYLILYGVYDEAEDNLLAFIKAVLLRLHSDEEPMPSNLLSIVIQIYLAPQGVELMLPEPITFKAEIPYLRNFLTVHLQKYTPPPRVS